MQWTRMGKVGCLLCARKIEACAVVRDGGERGWMGFGFSCGMTARLRVES